MSKKEVCEPIKEGIITWYCNYKFVFSSHWKRDLILGVVAKGLEKEKICNIIINSLLRNMKIFSSVLLTFFGFALIIDYLQSQLLASYWSQRRTQLSYLQPFGRIYSPHFSRIPCCKKILDGPWFKRQCSPLSPDPLAPANKRHINLPIYNYPLTWDIFFPFALWHI